MKTYAGFVKNTIEPLVDKIWDICQFSERRGMPVDKESLGELLEKAFLAHVVGFVLDLFGKIVITSIICYTVFRVL